VGYPHLVSIGKHFNCEENIDKNWYIVKNAFSATTFNKNHPRNFLSLEPALRMLRICTLEQITAIKKEMVLLYLATYL